MASAEIKFKIDENLPLSVAQRFHQSGYNAETVNDEGLRGATDKELIEECNKNKIGIRE